jgi:hypothetical protein
MRARREAKRLPKGFADLIKKNEQSKLPGRPVGDRDLASSHTKQACVKSPEYFRCNPEDEESLPVWEKFFVGHLGPGEEMKALGALNARFTERAQLVFHDAARGG